MAALQEKDVGALLHARQRLLNLQASLGALQQDLFTQQPLPSWPALQSHSELISTSLSTISQMLLDHQDLFASLSVYPLPQYPAQSQGHILDQLLRVKLEPDVQEWVQKGQTAAQPTSTAPKSGLAAEELKQLWAWAPYTANQLQVRKKFFGDYTVAERDQGYDSIVTGLQRELEELPESDESEPGAKDENSREGEDDEDDDMDVEESQVNMAHPAVAPKREMVQMPLESVHRFMMTGKIAG